MPLRIERVPIDRLRSSQYNPRKDLQPGDPEYIALERSLSRWDCVEPLVWNVRTGNLVAGHQRLKILKARGDREVDVSVVDLEPDDEAALNVALNKIDGAWDDQKLFEVLSDLDTRLDLTLTGFNPASLADLARGLTMPLFKPDVQPDVPQIETEAVTTRDVEHATAKQDTRFVGVRRELEDVTCPHCGGVFGL